MPRLTRFGAPYARLPQTPEARIEIFDPTKGLHAGIAPQALKPGYTPAAQNYTHSAGKLLPRSGLSRFDATFSVNDAVLGTFEALDAQDRRYTLAASNNTFALLPPYTLSWSSLSYIAASSGAAPTGDYTNRWDGTHVYEPSLDQNLAILTNGLGFPKFLVLDPSTTTFSDFTFAASLSSSAAACCAFDNRLLLANVNSSTSVYPQRVVWSDRGNPLTFTATNFADLMDMRGSIVRILPEQDGVLLFTEREIWRGRARADAYAFDFYPVFRSFGAPYPRTIVQTPLGTIFLGLDLEVYCLNGANVIPLGPESAGEPSRIQDYLRSNLVRPSLAWAAYNSGDRRYELYYATGTSLWPNKALFYHFDNTAWLPQTLPFPLTAGVESAEREGYVAWDDLTFTWDEYRASWDAAQLSSPARFVQAWSSAGTPYRFRSGQTTDDGTTIDARWRSHGLGQRDQFHFDTCLEVGVEYAADSACSLGVHMSANMGGAFDSAFTLALSATSLDVAQAPVLETAQAPCFEIRSSDGGTPQISRFQVRLRDASAYGGAL